MPTGALPTTEASTAQLLPPASVRVPAAADCYGMPPAPHSQLHSTEAAAVAGVMPHPFSPQYGSSNAADQVVDLWRSMSRDSRVTMVGDYTLLGGAGKGACGLRGLQVGKRGELTIDITAVALLCRRSMKQCSFWWTS